jgi:hypothetical protein
MKRIMSGFLQTVSPNKEFGLCFPAIGGALNISNSFENFTLHYYWNWRAPSQGS